MFVISTILLMFIFILTSPLGATPFVPPSPTNPLPLYTGDYETKAYGLFVGNHDSLGPLSTPYRADLMITRLANSFSKYNSEVTMLIGQNTPLIGDGGVKDFQVKAAIDLIKSKMDDDDVFFMYIAGHGVSKSNEDQSIHLGAYTPLDRDWMSDSELTGYLKDITQDKIVFIDSCYSGGFIQDVSGNDANDLSSLHNIYAMSSSTSDKKSYYMPNKEDLNDDLSSFANLPLFGLSLEFALNHSFQHIGFTSEGLFNFISATSLQYRLNDVVVLEEDFGDPTLFKSTMWNPQTYESNDIPEPVPEPATILLVGGGLAGLAARKRMKKNG